MSYIYRLPNFEPIGLKTKATYCTDNILIVPRMPVLQDKVVFPTIATQTITYDSTAYDGLNQITVNAVTHEIDANITAENLLYNVTILGITGQYNNRDTGDATAVAMSIKTGETAYVKGDKLTGTMLNAVGGTF